MSIGEQQGVGAAMDTRTAREAAEGSSTVQALLTPTRSLSQTEGQITYDTRANRAGAVGEKGDLYVESDTKWLYLYDGSAWRYEAGINVGTFAQMGAISLTAADEGAWFFVTDAGTNYGLWRVASGAFVKQFLPASPDVATEYRVNGNKIIGARKTGWTLPTSTKTRTNADYSTLTLTQLAEVLAALVNDLHSGGGAGSQPLLTA